MSTPDRKPLTPRQQAIGHMFAAHAAMQQALAVLHEDFVGMHHHPNDALYIQTEERSKDLRSLVEAATLGVDI